MASMASLDSLAGFLPAVRPVLIIGDHQTLVQGRDQGRDSGFAALFATRISWSMVASYPVRVSSSDGEPVFRIVCSAMCLVRAGDVDLFDGAVAVVFLYFTAIRISRPSGPY